jgi:hypothetical protein
MTTPIDRAIEEIARRDQRFPNQIRGASDDEIGALEQYASRAVPPDHRDFLRRMGHSSDWLVLETGDFSIDALITYYASGLPPPPPGYWMIARGMGDTPADMHLRHEGEDIWRVVSFPPAPRFNFATFALTHLRPVAGSLPQLLALAALRQLRLPRLPRRAVLEGLGLNQRYLPRLELVLATMGLSPAWYSDDWRLIYDDTELAIVAAELPDCPCVVIIHTLNVDWARCLSMRVRAVLHPERDG